MIAMQCVHCHSTENLGHCSDCAAPLCIGHRDRSGVTRCYNCRGTVDHLNAEVTLAILRAERLSEGSAAFQDAYLDVAFAEEALSALTSPRSVEGEISRRGAVTAALRAGRPSYAHGLACGYLHEDLAPSTRATLEQLRDEAFALRGLETRA